MSASTTLTQPLAASFPFIGRHRTITFTLSAINNQYSSISIRKITVPWQAISPHALLEPLMVEYLNTGSCTLCLQPGLPLRSTSICKISQRKCLISADLVEAGKVSLRVLFLATTSARYSMGNGYIR